MLRSMTGFGDARGVVDGAEFSVEVRSVNNRYFKPLIRLPENFAAAEAEMEKLLRSRLSRGSVWLTVRVRLPDAEAACKVNVEALGSYVAQLKQMEVEANPTLRIDLASLLQLPGVCEPPAEGLCERAAAGLKRLVTEALEKLLGMREQEGRGIWQELLGHCDTIERNLAAVSDRAPEVLRQYHERLGDRVRELTNAGSVKIDEETLAREVAIFAERSDIAEEISRLLSHVEQFRQAGESADPSGRKLDFIAQEMLREANTIASKGNDADIARAVVEIKTAVDRIKEQVQNVE